MTEKKYFNGKSASFGSNDRFRPRGSMNGFGRDRQGGGSTNGGYFGNNNNRQFPRSQSVKAPAPPSDLPVYKSFYQISPKTSNRNRYEIDDWLQTNMVSFRGMQILNPILAFDELLALPDGIMNSIFKQGFTIPTVIQAQAWPFALSGRDLVGIAQTGSGKTLAYALPALVHVEGNAHRRKYGPNVLVLAPTRELAQQIKEVFNMFRTRAVCVFGGASKVGQRREIERTQPSIIIACPGRLIDFVEEGTITLQNISYLVLDEADRMLDMGFEPQIRKIVTQVPKDRQTLMWSATWPKEVRKLAEDFLVNYIQINIGSISLSANHNITQIVDICEELEKIEKLYKLLTHIEANNRENKTIIFAETKRKVDQLSNQMKSGGWFVSALHGDKPQNERDWVLNDFRNGRNTILIATDVAARGLDVDDIKFVVNYDYPNCSEDYVHRIGRTGRRDKRGTAYTFFTMNNSKQANDLIDILKEAKQDVPQGLFELASQAHRFGKNIRRRYGNSGGGFYGRNNSGGFDRRQNGGYGGGGGEMKRKFDGFNRGGGALGADKRFKPTNGYSGGASGNYFNGSSGGGGPPAVQNRYNSFA